jgi:hypothetical protein
MRREQQNPALRPHPYNRLRQLRSIHPPDRHIADQQVRRNHNRQLQRALPVISRQRRKPARDSILASVSATIRSSCTTRTIGLCPSGEYRKSSSGTTLIDTTSYLSSGNISGAFGHTLGVSFGYGLTLLPDL